MFFISLLIFFLLFHLFVNYKNLHSFRHYFKLEKFYCGVIENTRIKSFTLEIGLKAEAYVIISIYCM